MHLDYTANMLVIEKDLDQSKSRQKTFACTVISATVLKDGITVRLSVESLNYTKEVEFPVKYQANNFCMLLARLQTSRGVAYRVFKEACGSKKSLNADDLKKAVQDADIKLPEGFVPQEETTFETFLQLFISHAPKNQGMAMTPKTSRESRDLVIRGGAPLAVSVTSISQLQPNDRLEGENQIIKPSPVAVMISSNKMRDGALTLTNYRLLFQVRNQLHPVLVKSHPNP
eukprot:1071426-Amorphochlora_amoeboformis.AAC.2